MSEPQLCVPAPPLGVRLSIPERDSERSLMMARGEVARSVRVMVCGTRGVLDDENDEWDV